MVVVLTFIAGTTEQVQQSGILSEVIVSITAILVAAIPAYFAILPQLQRRRQQTNEEVAIGIASHPFFNRAEMIKHHIDMTFSLENKGKEIVFKDIMMNQIEIYQEFLSEVCASVDRGEMETTHDLYNAHIEVIDRITYRHYHYYKDNPRYTHEEQQVLDRVMKKYVIWNKPRIDHLQESLRTICNSPYYTDIYTQAAVIMDTYLGVMVNTLNEASITLGSINGDLSGLTFKGITI